jgi:hypothetical protein
MQKDQRMKKAILSQSMAALGGLQQRQIFPEGGPPGGLEEAGGQCPYVNSETMTTSVARW